MPQKHATQLLGVKPTALHKGCLPSGAGNTPVLLRGVGLNLATAQPYLKIHQQGSLLIRAEGLSVCETSCDALTCNTLCECNINILDVTINKSRLEPAPTPEERVHAHTGRFSGPAVFRSQFKQICLSCDPSVSS